MSESVLLYMLGIEDAGLRVVTFLRVLDLVLVSLRFLSHVVVRSSFDLDNSFLINANWILSSVLFFFRVFINLIKI